MLLGMTDGTHAAFMRLTNSKTKGRATSSHHSSGSGELPGSNRAGPRACGHELQKGASEDGRYSSLQSFGKRHICLWKKKLPSILKRGLQRRIFLPWQEGLASASWLVAPSNSSIPDDTRQDVL